MWLLGTRIIFEPRNGSFWNTEEKKTLRDCSLTPVSRIILEHTSFGSALKASFVSQKCAFRTRLPPKVSRASLQNERFV